MNREEDLSLLLPDNINGFKTDNTAYYTPETLYDYIDGGAELYISYNFKDVVSRRYINDNGDEIEVELFDMQASDNAYGVFTQQREEESYEIAQECQIILGSIIFWRHKYFISLMNHRETPEVKKAMLEIALEISNKINLNGEKPKILRYLPNDKIIKNSIRYFKHYIWMNGYDFISDENILNISSESTAVLVKYKSENTKPILLLIEYKNANEQIEAWKNASLLYKIKSSKTLHIFKNKEQNNYSGIATNKKLIALVLHCSSKSEAQDILNNLNYQS